MRTISNEELKEILRKHKMWLNNEVGGEKANLSYSDLGGSDLSYSDLRGSNIDFSCMSYSCKDLKCNYDDRQIIQQLYHVIAHCKNSKNATKEVKKLLKIKTVVEIANKFHRVEECGKI